MDVHNNARLTPRAREALVRRVPVEGRRVSGAAADFGVTVKTVRKWLARHRSEGPAGLCDRPSTPQRSPNATAAATVSTILALRRARLTGAEIAARTTLSKATCRAHPPPPRPCPAAGARAERAGAALRTASARRARSPRRQEARPAPATGSPATAGIPSAAPAGSACTSPSTIMPASLYAEILADERQASAVAFLERAPAWFKRLGVTVERIMTDTGAAYRARTFADTCRQHGLRHLFTRPYTPRTNGKAERFIQTAIGESSDATSYPTSEHRSAALAPWLHRDNWHRPHMSLAASPPISRLRLPEDNLMRLHS